MTREETESVGSDIPDNGHSVVFRRHAGHRLLRLPSDCERRRLHAGRTSADPDHGGALRQRRGHVGLAPHGPAGRHLHRGPHQGLDSHRPDRRRLGQLAFHRSAAAGVFGDHGQRDHDPEFLRQEAQAELAAAANSGGSGHPRLLHLLCVVGHGRRREVLRQLLRLELLRRDVRRRPHHAGLHPVRRLPGRHPHRRRPGPPHAGGAHSGADRHRRRARRVV